MSLKHEAITGPDMPRSLGPYSHAVRAGDFIFVAGQAGIDLATGEAAPDFGSQARRAFENLGTVLNAAESGLDCVVKTTVFLADASAFATLNELYAEFFPVSPPVRSTPIVQLPRGLLISIECIAVVRE
jgi:2-iminobutanoate/2-iminopropanoate deaminase